MDDVNNNDGNVTVPPAQAPDAAQPDVSQQSGIQKRIDELTAQMRQAQEQNTQLLSTVTQQAAQLAQFMQQGQKANEPQQPADPFANVDWTDANSVKQAFVQSQQTVEQKFARQYQQLQAQMQQNEVLSVAAQFGVKDPAVVQYAQQAVQYWQQKGVPMNAMDAIRYAAGQAALGQLPQSQFGRPAQGAPHMPTQLPGSAPAPRGNGAPKGLPQNFDSLSLDQQEALLEKHLGDKPF